MNYTFVELQKQYEIRIPQIQRDYAQGREDKDNENKIKSYDFILKLIDVLTTDNPLLNLDFVYGYTKEIGENQYAFIPLDGQQRLTTLWLLHWYLSPKEAKQDDDNMMAVSANIKSYLKNFTYETRNSSKRFCEELINEYLPTSDNICATIKDAHWFMTSWQNDPTVVSMLNMLDTIQKQNFDKDKAWKNLTENRKITFDYIDIKSDEFKLTDELYIKMNARGKPLTSFENFKAQFSEILSAKDTDYINEKLDYEGSRVTFQEYFAFKIDSAWTDLFWSFAMEKKKDINSCFMNFFTYIAQMCYFKDNINKNVSDFKNDFSVFNVFKKNDNARFLFNVLDFFYKIGVDESNQVSILRITEFFEKLFLKGEIGDTYQSEVHLFEEKEVNLFEKCLTEGSQFDTRNRIILFCLLSYMIKYNLTEANTELRYYIRVVRNLLQATRQRNETVYNTNVRINSFGNYWKIFKQLSEKMNVYERLLDDLDNKGTDISDDALATEKAKAQVIVDNTSDVSTIQAVFKLEEFKHFGGLIHNLDPQNNVTELDCWAEYFREIFSCNDSVIIASLISCGFKGTKIRWCGLGDTYFWGKGDNWNTILAGQSKLDVNLSKPLISLLNKYQNRKKSNPVLKPQEILKTIVQEFINSLAEKNWQYYFCKYKKYFLTKSNYYSWNNDEFEHEILGSTSGNPLSAYHINPYIKSVSNLLTDAICQENRCYARYGYESYLSLNNGFQLCSKEDGWHIIIPEEQVISVELRKKYDISDNNVFKEINDKDRIEIAVDFCNDLTSECS